MREVVQFFSCFRAPYTASRAFLFVKSDYGDRWSRISVLTAVVSQAVNDRDVGWFDGYSELVVEQFENRLFDRLVRNVVTTVGGSTRLLTQHVMQLVGP